MKAKITLKFLSGSRAGDPPKTDIAEVVRIGRASDNNLVLSDTSVSGKHLELRVHPSGQLTARDLGSKRGTFVNGVRQTKGFPVKSGLQIQLGPEVVVEVRWAMVGDASESRLSPSDTVAVESPQPRKQPAKVGIRRPEDHSFALIVYCLRNPFLFRGRASRIEFWGFAAFALLAYMITSPMCLMVIRGLLIPALPDGGNQWAHVALVLPLVAAYLGFTVCLLFGLLSISVRRLHDGGRSGWHHFIQVVPYLGSLVLLFFLLKKGDPEANKYGEPL